MLLPGGTGGYTFVSFFTGTLPAAPETAAGRGEFLGWVLVTIFGLGVGATSGETVRSKFTPMLGNGATVLLSCFPGRFVACKAADCGRDAGGTTAGEALVIFGDSTTCPMSACLGAGGATGCGSGFGGGRRRACSWVLSRRRADFTWS